MKPHSLCFVFSAPDRFPSPWTSTSSVSVRITRPSKIQHLQVGRALPFFFSFFSPCSTLHYHKASKLQRHFIQPSANSHLVSSHSPNASEEKRCLCSNYSRPWSDWAPPLYPLRVSNTGKFFAQRPSEPSKEKSIRRKESCSSSLILASFRFLAPTKVFFSTLYAPCCTLAFLSDNRHPERCCLKTLGDAPLLISVSDIGTDNWIKCSTLLAQKICVDTTTLLSDVCIWQFCLHLCFYCSKTCSGNYGNTSHSTIFASLSTQYQYRWVVKCKYMYSTFSGASL